jgi:hypothetical protein
MEFTRRIVWWQKVVGVRCGDKLVQQGGPRCGARCLHGRTFPSLAGVWLLVPTAAEARSAWRALRADWLEAAWLAWLFMHLFFLIRFEHRVLVLAQWAWSASAADETSSPPAGALDGAFMGSSGGL